MCDNVVVLCFEGGSPPARANEDAGHRRARSEHLGQVPEREGFPSHAPQESCSGEDAGRLLLYLIFLRFFHWWSSIPHLKNWL